MERIPPPPDNTTEPLRALIFDSAYDLYKVAGPPLLAFSYLVIYVQHCYLKPKNDIFGGSFT